MLDLKEDFGFTIGRWNQAYMYDTLPLDLGGPANMKPGDLVFVTAIYSNPKCKYFSKIHYIYLTMVHDIAKQQKHNVVHVEIWLGDGDKTVGARWQKGVVEIHNSYQYASKSYHSMKYHFRSIDTWLNGICESYCDQHPWKLNKRTLPGKKSIFCYEQQEADPVEQNEMEENELLQCDVMSQENDEIPEQYLPHDPINKPDESSHDQSSSASSDDGLSGI